MRILTLGETTQISGSSATGAFITVGGIIGAYYGACTGATIAAPFSLIGLAFAFSAPEAIIPGIAISCGIFGVGLIGGALIGGFIGAAIGAAGGIAADTVMHQAKQ